MWPAWIVALVLNTVLKFVEFLIETFKPKEK